MNKVSVKFFSSSISVACAYLLAFYGAAKYYLLLKNAMPVYYHAIKLR